MKQIKLKDEQVFAQVHEKCLLVQGNVGWTVVISPEKAVKYCDSFDANDNSQNKENWGFYSVSEGVVLTHQDAKLSLSKADTSALIELVRAAENEIWE